METPYHLRQKILHGTFRIVSVNKLLLEASQIHCFFFRSIQFGLRNSVSCPFPYGFMQETLFLTSSASGKYNNHATILSFRSSWLKRRCFYPYTQWI